MNIVARLNIGGPAVAVTMLAQKFRERGYESDLVCGTIEPGEGDMTYYAVERGVEPIIIPELGRSLSPVRDIKTLWKVYQLIRERQPDVVHTHAAKAGFVGRVAAWMAGVPVIVHTFHGHVFRGYFSPSRTRIFIWLERLTARLSDTIITLSDGLRRELAEEYHITRKGRITVLPLGLDLEPFIQTPRHQGQFRAAWNISPDAPLVGIIGRLTPIKNHTLFLKAAQRLRQQFPAARFVIVGDGESRRDIEAKVDELGLRPAVILTGWQKDMAPIYSDLDVLVVTSINEGTPVVVIEALANCCPVVSTEVGGLPDLLDHGKLGRLTPSDDVEAMSQAISQTLKSPPDGESAQRLMIDRYGIDRLMQDLDGLYRGILTRKRGTMSRS